MKHYSGCVAQCLNELRLAGVNCPYVLILSTDVDTMASSGSDEGYPVLQHIRELVDNDIIWALAIQGRYWVTKSQRHKDKLCLEASFMFQYYTSEADVYLKPAGK